MEIRGAAAAARREKVLTPEALAFVADLVRRFRPRVEELLERRREMQRRYDAGERPTSSPRPRRSAPATGPSRRIPPDLQDRRVEITGPVDRKMIINALNSGANVFMADFEDSNSPDLGERRRGPGEPARRGATAPSTYAAPGRASTTG